MYSDVIRLCLFNPQRLSCLRLYRLLPAGHEHSTVRLQVDAANHQGGISQNVAVAEFIQVEEHVAGMAGELFHVAVGSGLLCTGHR